MSAFCRCMRPAYITAEGTSCDGVMTIADALNYLPQNQLDSWQVLRCAAAKCQNTFAPADGFATEAIIDDRISITFFCSAGCYLTEIPVCCCGRA